MSAADQLTPTHAAHAMRFINRDEALDLLMAGGMPNFLHLRAESAIVQIYGDTMAPEYESGDTVLINAAWCAIGQPGVYVLRTDDGFIAQRCNPVPYSEPRMVVLCRDARTDPMETVPASSLDVVGFVVCGVDTERHT